MKNDYFEYIKFEKNRGLEIEFIMQHWYSMGKSLTLDSEFYWIILYALCRWSSLSESGFIY